MLITIVILLLFGLTSLSLTLSYPHRKLFSLKPKTERHFLLRALGFGLLVLSFIPVSHATHLGSAICLWFGLISIVSTFLILLYSYLPKYIFLRGTK